MIRLLSILTLAAGLAGCVVAPPYGYAPGPAYQSGPGYYGYAPGYYGYAPGYYAAPAVDLGVGIGFGGYGGGGGGFGDRGGHGR